MITTGSTRPLYARLFRHDTEDVCTQVLGPGCHQLANAACCTIEQNVCALANRVSGFEQVLSSDAFEQNGSRFFKTHIVRQLY
ncbi:hypothetical protein D9M71_744420 [compost metagenome]